MDDPNTNMDYIIVNNELAGGFGKDIIVLY